MAKIFGFFFGIIVAVAGPAAFGVFAPGGDYSLNSKETALLHIGWAVALWVICSLFSGAAALGAGLTLAALTYLFLFIPDQACRALNDVPGVSGGMAAGLRNSVTSGIVPIAATITLIFGVQLAVLAWNRARRRRDDEARAAAREQLDREEASARLRDQEGPHENERAGGFGAGAGAGPAGYGAGGTDRSTQLLPRSGEPARDAGGRSASDDTVVAAGAGGPGAGGGGSGGGAGGAGHGENRSSDNQYDYLYRPRKAGSEPTQPRQPDEPTQSAPQRTGPAGTGSVGRHAGPVPAPDDDDGAGPPAGSPAGPAADDTQPSQQATPGSGGSPYRGDGTAPQAPPPPQPPTPAQAPPGANDPTGTPNQPPPSPQEPPSSTQSAPPAADDQTASAPGRGSPDPKEPTQRPGADQPPDPRRGSGE